MKVIGQDGEAKQINSEASCEQFELIFDPDFTMVEVLPGNGVEAEEKAASDDSSNDMQDSHFVWIEDFSTSKSSHNNNLPKNSSLEQTGSEIKA